MFRSDTQSYSVWCTERGAAGRRRGPGRGRGGPALSARSFRANSVAPFHPWLVRDLASCGLSFHSAGITGIRGKWCQRLGFMASSAELPDVFIYLKFCDSLAILPFPGYPRASKEERGVCLGPLLAWGRIEGQGMKKVGGGRGPRKGCGGKEKEQRRQTSREAERRVGFIRGQQKWGGVGCILGTCKRGGDGIAETGCGLGKEALATTGSKWWKSMARE